MRRFGCVLLLAAVLLTGCSAQSVVGRWTTDDPSDYSFQLNKDGTCTMFNAADEWVSAGTYTAYSDHIVFDTDTGVFVWVWDDERDAMRFDANGTVMYYRLQE